MFKHALKLDSLLQFVYIFDTPTRSHTLFRRLYKHRPSRSLSHSLSFPPARLYVNLRPNFLHTHSLSGFIFFPSPPLISFQHHQVHRARPQPLPLPYHSTTIDDSIVKTTQRSTCSHTSSPVSSKSFTQGTDSHLPFQFMFRT